MADEHRGILSLKYPIKRGVIHDWEGMEHLWQHTFSELDANPEEHPVLLIDSL